MEESNIRCHVVAIPYPGRGHINSMMNLCKQLASRCSEILVSFVVTEEWLGFLSSESRPATLSFRTIPNVIPSELVRAADFPGFFQAVMTKMEDPVAQLLDLLQPPTSLIIYDTLLTWVVEIGIRRNISIASFWPMSATVLSIYHHFELLIQNGHYPTDLSVRGDEMINYIPGVPPMRITDLPTPFHDKNPQIVRRVHEAIQLLSKVQYLLVSTIYELESPVIDALKQNFPTPIYSIGPNIPYFELEDASESPDYIKWLDAQPKDSVMYISQGSFLSVSSSQLAEIISGVRKSGVKYLWVARGNDSLYSDEKGLVVPWCDQLKVLCHSSVGGFWTHCGWNSTKEALFAGVPVLTFPIMLDQVLNSKKIVSDWGVGWAVKRNKLGVEILVTKEEIGILVNKFMDLNDEEGREMRRRSNEVMMLCKHAIEEGGSFETNIDAFIADILH